MKKTLSILLIVVILAIVLAACGSTETEQSTIQNYTGLTEWNYHPSYNFLLTSVEEQGDSVLLRGVIARNTLTPEEVEAARTEGTIEINGKTFIHTDINIEGSIPNDRLYNEYTEIEIFLVPAFFGEFEGDDLRYRMYEPDGQSIVHKRTGMYHEVEVDINTPVEIWRPVVEQMEWGYLEMFAPMEASAYVFTDYTRYDIPDGFPFDGAFILTFENGKCIHLRWNR